MSNNKSELYPLSMHTEDQDKFKLILEEDFFTLKFSKLKSLSIANIDVSTLSHEKTKLYKSLEQLRLLHDVTMKTSIKENLFLICYFINQFNCVYRDIRASMSSNLSQDSDDESLNNNERRTDIVTGKNGCHVNGNTRATTSLDPIDSMVSAFGKTRLRSSSSSSDDSSFSRRTICRNGLGCYKSVCSFKHPPGWDPCEDGIDCEEFDCSATHPFNRKGPCRNGRRCRRPDCHFLHPILRPNACPHKDKCRVWKCSQWHPKRRPTDCPFGEQCYNITCKRLHPLARQLCPNGVECNEFDCQLGHPSSRKICCNQGSACDNFFCSSLHPADWDPCEQGSECKNPDCPHTNHPSDHISRLEEKTHGTEKRDYVRPPLKSLEQRQVERKQPPLPMIAVKDEFCERLKNERILVVTAETGSGKSTQLPQYAAEFFGGLVICTQPRVTAAISLARRVADEYDGTSVGHSVGYRVGHASVGKDKNRVPGTDILYMTDGTFIQESQVESHMSEVRVLIVDEVHERTLNTDIVIGIAKRLLETRPTDFYVVISSATMDTDKFLAFFQRTDVQPLKVPGRLYPVSVDYIPKVKKSTEERVISTILKLYDQHQGNILAFLPGQREIENAIELFRRKAPDNCIALPLYSSLSTEEQDLVLKFDEGPDKQNRMVIFCTNIAETSLTIKDVGLVIDSGLVNEGYFEYENRLNVIGAVQISRASAEQRRGRAGRTALGHCVRLYEEDELILPDTKPQILRSSLDLVVLQLISLELNPQEFPFIDPPDKKHIQASLDLLKDLSCIDATHIINHKGKLFAKLGIDPRYSAFLLDTYLEHGPILELAATIVAILIAPASVFAITGETKEEKESGRDRVAKNARKFASDLFYLVSLYKDWHSVGALVSETRTCLTCGKSYNKDYSCGPCRAAYSRTHLLNNKILNYIESMSDELITTIKDPHWQLDPSTLSDVNESAIIGANLFKYFSERHGCLDVSSSSNKEYAHMTKTNIHARITDTSTFYRRQTDKSYFIATSMAKLPNGTFVIDRLHPVPPPSDTSEDEEVSE